MNWSYLRLAPWLDTRARFIAGIPTGGALLDLGSSDGETLRHIAELRPDLRLFAADVAGQPETYPSGCQFHRADFHRDKLPLQDRSVEAITCMHLVEHLNDLTLLMQEAVRLLKPGGRFYVETPHPRSLKSPSLRGRTDVTFTLNFYDDPTHVKLVTIEALSQEVRRVGLEVVTSGVSRNWLFAASHLFYFFRPPSRQKYTAWVHWLGWSAYLIARQPC